MGIATFCEAIVIAENSFEDKDSKLLELLTVEEKNNLIEYYEDLEAYEKCGHLHKSL